MTTRAARARAKRAAKGVATEEAGAEKKNTCLGYAARLSPYEDKGKTGLPERVDSARALTVKLAKLVALVRASKSMVVLTGAGISTAAGIPDFRGPKGIWTREDDRAKKRRRGSSIEEDDDDSDRDDDVTGASFEAARPTRTHMAVVALERAGRLAFCATQNVDGLHARSGLPRSRLGVLHGCVFTERCESCGAEVLHDRDVGGISFRPTGRACLACGGAMRDTVLDWTDPLPDVEWDPATAAFEAADLCLCLGTSLRIIPAADLPLHANQFVVVNLQTTPMDTRAALVIRAKVDDVMAHLLDALAIAIPDDVVLRRPPATPPEPTTSPTTATSPHYGNDDYDDDDDDDKKINDDDPLSPPCPALAISDTAAAPTPGAAAAGAGASPSLTLEPTPVLQDKREQHTEKARGNNGH